MSSAADTPGISNPTYDPAFHRFTWLSGAQRRAADPAFQAAHPATAAIDMYNTPFDAESNMAYQLGRWTRERAQMPNALGRYMDHGPIPGGLLFGALGAGLGAGTGWLLNRGKRRPSKLSPWALAALGGLSLGAAGAYSGYLRSKTASWRDPASDIAEAREALLNLTAQASDIPFQTKSQIMATLPDLNSQQLDNLLGNIVTAGGAGAGMVLARSLGMGYVGTAMGGLLGGMLGHSLTQRPALKNSLGFPAMGP